MLQVTGERLRLRVANLERTAGFVQQGLTQKRRRDSEAGARLEAHSSQNRKTGVLGSGLARVTRPLGRVPCRKQMQVHSTRG